MATEEVITKLCNILGSDTKYHDLSLRQPAVKCLATMFSSTDQAIVNCALSAGILPRFIEALENAPTMLIEYILFATSNIAAGTPEQCKTLLDEEELLTKVF